MEKNKILIYGAGGYMGKLFTAEAVKHKLPIVLASRQAFNASLELRVFSLNHAGDIEKKLSDIRLVINLAGPFVQTNKALIEACIKTRTHYIDIAGEVPEFEQAYTYNSAAIEAGIMVMPGAGFGVVPTDIAARIAKERLPDATKLTIAYSTVGGVSRGTLKTVLKDINKEGVEMVNGSFVKATPAGSDFSFEAFGEKHRAVYNPWRADLFTAHLSTGIPNISTYSAFPGLIERMMKGKLLWLRDLLLTRLLFLLPLGPSAKQLQSGKTIVYAQVINAKGQKAHVSIKGPEAYLFTALTLVNISKIILDGNIKSGFQTPSIWGKELISGIEKVEIQ